LLTLVSIPAYAQQGGPLVITLSTDKQVAVAAEPLWLTISITNVSNRPFSAPNIRFGGSDDGSAIHAGMLLPRVINSQGQLVKQTYSASLGEGPGERMLVNEFC
jgi:hypothetical protein